MLQWIAGRARSGRHPIAIVVGVMILVVGGVASGVQTVDPAREWPTGQQFLGMSDPERVAYVSGFMWGAAAQLADAHLRAGNCQYPALQHLTADAIAEEVATAIAQTPAAANLSVWIVLNEALRSSCQYEPAE